MLATGFRAPSPPPPPLFFFLSLNLASAAVDQSKKCWPRVQPRGLPVPELRLRDICFVCPILAVAMQQAA